MVFTFTLKIEDNETFVREIAIDADATFSKLRTIVEKACDFEADPMTCFYICNEDWEQEKRIIPKDMDDAPEDDDVFFMEDTTLRDILTGEDDRVAFVYDMLDERMIFMKVTSVDATAHKARPAILKSVGKAPKQHGDFDYDKVLKDLDLEQNNPFDEEEDAAGFYGSEGFNDDEFDMDGFEIEDR